MFERAFRNVKGKKMSKRGGKKRNNLVGADLPLTEPAWEETGPSPGRAKRRQGDRSTRAAKPKRVATWGKKGERVGYSLCGVRRGE